VLLLPHTRGAGRKLTVMQNKSPGIIQGGFSLKVIEEREKTPKKPKTKGRRKKRMREGEEREREFDLGMWRREGTTSRGNTILMLTMRNQSILKSL